MWRLPIASTSVGVSQLKRVNLILSFSDTGYECRSETSREQLDLFSPILRKSAARIVTFIWLSVSPIQFSEEGRFKASCFSIKSQKVILICFVFINF